MKADDIKNAGGLVTALETIKKLRELIDNKQDDYLVSNWVSFMWKEIPDDTKRHLLTSATYLIEQKLHELGVEE
jgi:hypothetical protein